MERIKLRRITRSSNWARPTSSPYSKSFLVYD